MQEDEKNKQDKLETASDNAVSRRQFLGLVGAAGATLAVGGGLAGLVAGCGSSGTTASSKTSVTTGAGGGTNVIKIGGMDNLTTDLGVDQKKCLALCADTLNKQGGITVGGQKYTVEVIMYDDKGDPTSAKSAFNELVEQKKCNFILGDFWSADTLMPLAEAKKVVLSCEALSPAILNPRYKYCFNTAALANSATTAIAGVSAIYPGNSWVITMPDNMQGHATGANIDVSTKAFGMKGQVIYFPASTTDYSSVATKVKSQNPQLFGSGGEAVVYKAVKEAGYKGKLAGYGLQSTETLLAQVPADELEGYVGPAYYTEFDTPSTQLAKDFKDAYIAKYGKWQNPSIAGLATFYAVVAAIQKANSLDPTKVADTMAGGLTYESPGLSYQLVARPDKRITRTVDSVVGLAMKKITGGKNTQVAMITTAQAAEYATKTRG